MEYSEVLEVRKKQYADHLLKMSVDPAVKAWSDRMESKYESKTVKVWHNELPWLEALMVVRYGEAVEHWPLATTVADWGRALDWESEKEIPHAVIRAQSMKL